MMDLKGVRLPEGYRDPAKVRRRLDKMEYLLERSVRIPGTSKRLGLDVILDFVPVGGSVVAAAMGTWIAWEARNLGVSRGTIVRMGGNIGVDMLLGAIPFVGAIPDYFFRSNTRNVKLVRRWLDQHHPEALVDEIPSGTPRRSPPD
jgi:hypothetical protein